MATPLKAWELVFQFALNRVGTNEDVAEFSLWMGSDTLEPGDAELPHLAAGGVNAWQNNMNQAHWATNVAFSYVTATAFNTDGTIKAQAQEVAGGDWVGTADTAALPWETSLCTSLYTYPRGTFVPQQRRKRGRFYLPPMAADQLDPSNSGYFNDGSLPDLLTEIMAFLQDAEKTDVGVSTGTLSVFSRKDSLLRPVSQVSIDAKFDSQRRRQNRENVGWIAESFS